MLSFNVYITGHLSEQQVKPLVQYDITTQKVNIAEYITSLST